MNTIQLKVKLVSLNTEYVGTESKIVVSGMAKYQFCEQGKMKTRSMAYRAFGPGALVLQSAGKDSVHAITGQLNVYPPNDQNPNHSMLLTISKALPVAITKTPVKPQPVAQPKKLETLQDIPF